MKFLKSAALVAVLAIIACIPAQAQQAGAINSVTPMTRELGVLKTLTAQTAATLTTADQTGFNVSRLVCVFNMSAHTGTPSTTFTIQNKDAASGLYYTVLTSGAIVADATPTPLSVGAGITTTANVSAGLPLARVWRVSITVAGTSPVVTGTLGCSVQ